MNLKILSIETMIVLAKFWLTHPLAAAILASHQVGMAIRTQLQVVYEMLLTLDKRRNDARGQIAVLTQMMSALDKRHDNAARALYHHLLALRALAPDPDSTSFFERLLDICYPDGLAIINRSYLEESGFAESLAEQLTPALRARMATVQVGTYNLEELAQLWIDAGRELGQRTLERHHQETTHAATSESNAAIRANTVRSHWIQTVLGMRTATRIMELSGGDQETLFAPLYRSIAAAETRTADTGDDGASEPDGEPEPEPDGTPEPEIGEEAGQDPEEVSEPESDPEAAVSAHVPATAATDARDGDAVNASMS